ncbi:MAG: toxin HicA [Moraxellaceae bacterium]|nr:MAG: toxin HicA [Moraxellaceae bacterium]
MVKTLETLELMRSSPKGIRFNDVCKVCDEHFGEPRVNIHNSKGKAKPYQVLRAIERLEVGNN